MASGDVLIKTLAISSSILVCYSSFVPGKDIAAGSSRRPIPMQRFLLYSKQFPERTFNVLPWCILFSAMVKVNECCLQNKHF